MTRWTDWRQGSTGSEVPRSRWRRFPACPLLVGLFAVLALGLVLSFGGSSGARADFTPPTTSNWVAIDCNLTTPGVQDACAAIVGQPLEVGVVVGNVTGIGTPGPQPLAALNFFLSNSQKALLSPQVSACSGTSIDCNPDFNNLEIPGGWDCSYVPPLADQDFDANPATSQSRLVCINPLLNSPAIPQNSSVLLAKVRYDALAVGVTHLSLERLAVGNHLAGALATCNPDLSGTSAVCGTAQVTILDGAADGDGDGISNATDNCPFHANALQTNTDSGPSTALGNIGAIGNGAFLPGHDLTVPGGDTLGDACDIDSDNDGLPDTLDLEPGLPRDLTVDDDGDGNPAVGCFGGTDADDDGVSWDTNCDGKLDGAPADCGSGTLDADGDGLLDAWETCRWQTSNSSTDSDGDGLGDCTEAFDINGNSLVTNADAVFVAQVVFNVNPADWAFDINGNGTITNADAIFIQRAVFGVTPCI